MSFENYILLMKCYFYCQIWFTKALAWNPFLKQLMFSYITELPVIIYVNFSALSSLLGNSA